VTNTNNSANPADPGAVAAALEGLFSTHEARVLGAISLFVGYLSIFFTKVMNFTEMYVGVLGIVGLIILLLLLSKEFDWRSGQAWLRCIAVVVIGIFLTSPQLYFAWTVSVSEARLARNVALDDRALFNPIELRERGGIVNNLGPNRRGQAN
jgi:hypothetical protein